ncbi:MAG TPA: beta-methylarginine biosynthesis bifunctional aminotransferase [Kofleriaceae bacterium]|jgi:beta-methylarginine biosynthesis bifunctional aminotransferase|nr:beta-methylarginine biosynthesis bifunctional aminotransferase [Kofleriaceae bacterium]
MTFPRIVRDDVPFTALQQRLLYMSRYPDRDWVNVVENVPVWPMFPVMRPPAPLEADTYGSCWGDPRLVAAIQRRERSVAGRPVADDQIVVTSGALHAISLVLRTAVEPGRRVACLAPMFRSICEMFAARGCPIRLFSAASVESDAGADELVRDDVGCVYLNSPNNPSGEVVSQPAVRRLAHRCARAHIPLVVDAVYDDFLFQDTARTAALAATDDWRWLYVVNSMSKNYGAPGLRIGWVITAADNAKAIAGLLERECVAISGPSQAVAAQLLADGNQPLVAAVRAGREIAIARIAEISGASFVPPRGGTQLCVRLAVDDVEQFGDFALDRFGLALATRSQYEGLDGPFIRFPLGAPAAIAAAAASRLEAALAAYAALQRS